MHTNIITCFKNCKVIAAVRNESELKKAIVSKVDCIFILNCSIFSATNMVFLAINANKKCFIHTDFIEGLSNDLTAIDYIHQNIKPTGIISAKPTTIKHAKSLDMFAIERFFIIDSSSMITMNKTVSATKPDVVEIMPGIMPTIISKTVTSIYPNVIAGGLIQTREDINSVVSAGALAASTGNQELWSS